MLDPDKTKAAIESMTKLQKQILLKRMLNPEMTVSSIALNLNTSKSYVSTTLNAHYDMMIKLCTSLYNSGYRG